MVVKRKSTQLHRYSCRRQRSPKSRDPQRPLREVNRQRIRATSAVQHDHRQPSQTHTCPIGYASEEYSAIFPMEGIHSSPARNMTRHKSGFPISRPTVDSSSRLRGDFEVNGSPLRVAPRLLIADNRAPSIGNINSAAIGILHAPSTEHRRNQQHKLRRPRSAHSRRK